MRKKVIFSMGFAGVLAFSTALSAIAAPFDAEYYAEQNPDVAAAVGNDPAMLELHYNTYGINEGRAANATDAPLGRAVSFEEFDAEYYALQYPDVAAVFGNDPMSLYTHYLAVGRAEGRAPSAAAAAASHSGSGGSSEDNPYARFASSGSGSSHHSHSHSSSKSSSDEDEKIVVIENDEIYATYNLNTRIFTMYIKNAGDAGWLGYLEDSSISDVICTIDPYLVSGDNFFEHQYGDGEDDYATFWNGKETSYDFSEQTGIVNGYIAAWYYTEEGEEFKKYEIKFNLDLETGEVTGLNTEYYQEEEETEDVDETTEEETAVTAAEVSADNTAEETTISEDGAETETLTSESADESEEVSEEEETTEDPFADDCEAEINEGIEETESTTEEEVTEEKEAEGSEVETEEESEAEESVSEETEAEENQEESEDEPETEGNAESEQEKEETD